MSFLIMRPEAKKSEVNYASVPCNVKDVSYPSTEVGAVDNASIFSDSVDFDAADKPHAAGRNASNNDNSQNDMVQPVPVADQAAIERGCPEVQPAQKQGSPTAIKSRHKPLKEPIRWEPLDLVAPKNGPEDEFDIGTARKPVFHEESEKPNNVFVNGEPDLEGEVISCFEEPGLLYRIVDKKNKIWAFYNESLSFEVHVSCTFGKHSKVEPLGQTTMHQSPDGGYIAEVVVYPAETEMFVKGFVNGFSSQLRALPLSDEYFASRYELQNTNVVEKEINQVEELVGQWKGADHALKLCVENDLPFTDLDFLPNTNSIQRGSTRPQKQLPWFRPRMYLRQALHDQVRLFRKPIVPGDVQQGELGDCWLMCAIATLEENPEDVMCMFRHPLGAEMARRERAVGAYRVTLNTSGLWSSVVVDDYFPGYAGAPVFAHSSDLCELWPSVLEKAFAKVNGSYGVVQSGDPVHALTDMTGCPSSRFDDAFLEAQRDGGKELFEQLYQNHKSGFQIILTTAGKAPAFVSGTNKPTNIFGDEPELEKVLGNTGLLPGHAYTITDVRCFPEDGGVKLVQIRNVWGSCEEWKGPWSRESPEWDMHPTAKNVCKKGLQDDNVIWMDWEHVLQYFIGGGVVYRHLAYDYRVPLTFTDCRPSLVFEVTVDSPVWVCFTLSNINPRTALNYEEHADQVHEYPPLMLSLCSKQNEEDGVHRVLKNTSVDTTKPSADKWTFVQAREIGMLCKLTPEESPYLLVPRMMESEDTLNGSNAWFANLHSQIHPLYFNNRNAAHAEVAEQGGAEIPVVLGIRCSKSIGAEGNGGVKVSFKSIDDDALVFENFPKFSAETVEQNDMYYQVMPPRQGFVEEKLGASIF